MNLNLGSNVVTFGNSAKSAALCVCRGSYSMCKSSCCYIRKSIRSVLNNISNFMTKNCKMCNNSDMKVSINTHHENSMNLIRKSLFDSVYTDVLAAIEYNNENIENKIPVKDLRSTVYDLMNNSSLFLYIVDFISEIVNNNQSEDDYDDYDDINSRFNNVETQLSSFIATKIFNILKG